MFARNTLKATLLASVCLLPLSVAMADDGTGFDLPEAMPNTQELQRISKPQMLYDNEVDIGMRGQSGSSAVFGRYTGYAHGGASVLGSWAARQRSDWKSDSTFFYESYGRDLDFGRDIAPSSSLGFKFGEQGIWGVNATYDVTSYVQSLNLLSFYDRSGTWALGGPGVPMASGNGSLRPVNQATYSGLRSNEVGLRRDKGAVDGKYRFGDWQLSAELSHEHKEGNIGSSFDLASIESILLPVSYDTDRYNTTLAYTTSKLQGKLAYTASTFRNEFKSLRLDNIQANASNANIVLPPDNQAHQLAGQLGYNLGESTRFNLNGTYGVQLQNDSILAQTSGLGIVSNYPGTPGTLNGVVQTIFTNASMTTRLFHNADLRMAYTLDMREGNRAHNQVRQNEIDGATVWVRNALSQSWIKNVGVIEAGYRILPSTKLTLGYTITDMQRSNAQVGETLENKVSAKVRTTFAPGVTGAIGYDHSVRTASDVNIARPWVAFNNTGDCNQRFNATGPYCSGIPFYQAARTQDVVPARITAAVGDDATVSMNAKYTSSNYSNQEYGVKREYAVSAGPDATYRIADGFDTHAFYTFQRTYRTMAMTGGTDATRISAAWSEATTIDTSTFGMGATWVPMANWKFGSDYLFSYGNEGIYESLAGSAVSGDQLRVNTMTHSAKVYGEYEFEPGSTLYFGYSYDRLISSDPLLWGGQFAGTGGVSGTFMSGESNPSYAVHTIMTRVGFKW